MDFSLTGLVLIVLKSMFLMHWNRRLCTCTCHVVMWNCHLW